MEKLRMPESYATLPEEELPEIFGGGELGDALDSLTAAASTLKTTAFPSVKTKTSCAGNAIWIPLLSGVIPMQQGTFRAAGTAQAATAEIPYLPALLRRICSMP